MIYRIGLIVTICLFLAGCHPFCSSSGRVGRLTAAPIVKKETIDYVGDLPPTQAGKEVALVRMKAATTKSRMALFTGNFIFSGKIQPDNAADFLPDTVRFELRKKSARGQIQAALPFVVAVQNDGTIKPQKFSFATALFVSPKESVEVAIIPVDAALPASHATLKFKYLPTAASSQEDTVADQEFAAIATEAKKFAFSYTGLLPPALKGVAEGDFRFTAVSGLDTVPVGNLNVKGKLASEDGSPLPTQLQIIVKYTTAKGKVLATERYDVRVNTDGTVPLQKYPLDTTVAAGTAALQFSAVAVDRDFPLSSVQLNIFFTQS